MNKRIKLLAEQAGHDIKPLYKGEDDYKIPHYKDEKLEKFAELIVKEMVDECAKVCVQHTGWTPDMIAKQVKQHFGVKE